MGRTQQQLTAVAGLLFGIVLARLLSRSDYGMIGMLTIFSTIANILQESGFISALVNRKNASDKDYNAVFWFSVSCSAILYILLYLVGSTDCRVYRTPELVPLSRLTFLSFFIASLGIAPRAILFRNLKVKENTIISLSSLTLSGITAIVLAVNGFAYWGIAIQSTCIRSVVVILNWYFAKWMPSFLRLFS